MIERTAPAPTQTSSPPVSTKPRRVRPIAYLLGFALLPLDAWWVISCEDVGRGPYPTTISLFANAVFILALLALANTAVARISRRIALNQAEMLVVYVIVCIGASLAGLDVIAPLMQVMAHPHRFATPENQWMALFGEHLPQQLIMRDPAVLKGYYEGHSSLYSPGIIRAWLAPALWWTAFIGVLMCVAMCINTLVRQQWSARERLAYPIIQLPLAMAEPEGKLWRNKVMWAGFAISAGIEIVNGLSFYYPSIPHVQVRHYDIGYLVTTKPWSAIGWTPISYYPFVIGLGFLLPADLSFSCWFFYLFWKAQMVIARANAWDSIPDFPFVKHQALGGVGALLVMLLWSSRGYLKQVWLLVIGRKSELDDSREAISYRTAALGVLIGGTLLVWFAWRVVGLSPVIGVAVFVFYFALSTAIARMRAELGPPVHDFHLNGPDLIIPTSLGTRSFSTQDLTAMNTFFWLNRAYRGHPMAGGMEAMQMAQESKASQRSFLVAVMLAVVLGVIAAMWVYLHIAYIRGAGTFWQGTGHGQEAYRRLEGWVRNPAAPKGKANIAMLVGFATCVFLGAMRMQFFGWPLHPIGYAISGNWAMNLVWLPIMIAWLAKVIVLKSGGMKLYRSAVPFFLGLILGEMLAGSTWTLIGLALGEPVYSFWGA